MMWYDGMSWWMITWVIMMVLFWVGIIALIIFGIRKLTQRSAPSMPERRSPLDIAKERYAKGEISKEQFEQIKKDLE